MKVAEAESVRSALEVTQKRDQERRAERERMAARMRELDEQLKYKPSRLPAATGNAENDRLPRKQDEGAVAAQRREARVKLQKEMQAVAKETLEEQNAAMAREWLEAKEKAARDEAQRLKVRPLNSPAQSVLILVWS